MIRECNIISSVHNIGSQRQPVRYFVQGRMEGPQLRMTAQADELKSECTDSTKQSQAKEPLFTYLGP